MGILGAFVIAVLMAFLFSGYKRKDSIMPLIILFLVLFFAGLVSQFWIVPFGPVLWGVNWLSMILTILVFALLFSAPAPHIQRAEDVDTKTDPSGTAISVFIWIILILLIVASLIGYYNTDTTI